MEVTHMLLKRTVLVHEAVFPTQPAPASRTLRLRGPSLLLWTCFSFWGLSDGAWSVPGIAEPLELRTLPG